MSQLNKIFKNKFRSTKSFIIIFAGLLFTVNGCMHEISEKKDHLYANNIRLYLQEAASEITENSLSGNHRYVI